MRMAIFEIASVRSIVTDGITKSIEYQGRLEKYKNSVRLTNILFIASFEVDNRQIT